MSSSSSAPAPAPAGAPEERIDVRAQQIPDSDVFLNFWCSDNEDASKNFADRLYDALTKICVCNYEVGENIHNAERISDDHIKTIEDSKFYINVFSKNYASSSRCLEELVKIMECHKKSDHTAYAVFYDVKRTEVRDQSGAVGDAFSEHENQEATGRWKGALKEAADLDGWELELNTLEHEDKFIRKIVQKISLALFAYEYPVLNKLVEALFAVNVDLTLGSTFSFIITCLLAFAGLKSQSVTGFPFTTHPNAIKVPVTSLLIYAFASGAERVVSGAGHDHTSVYAIIARLGCISSLCLFVTSLAILIYI